MKHEPHRNQIIRKISFSSRNKNLQTGTKKNQKKTLLKDQGCQTSYGLKSSISHGVLFSKFQYFRGISKKKIFVKKSKWN